MKRIATLLFIVVWLSADCQNLVPNSSFEDTVSCLLKYHAIESIPPLYTPSQGRPDLLHTCMTGFDLQVPNKIFGYQQPFHGSAFAGFFLYQEFGSNDKEYISVKLSDTLRSQTPYECGFYVNLGDNSGYAIDKIGMFLSKDSIYENTFGTLPYIAQIESPPGQYLNDTTLWIRISGVYIAQGGERYLTIGNFRNWLNTSSQHLFGTSVAYYFIDSVFVYDFTTSIIPFKEKGEIKIYPNPATETLNVSILNNHYSLQAIFITNLDGKQILQTTQTEIPVSHFAKGLYFVRVEFTNGQSVVKKVVIQ